MLFDAEKSFRLISGSGWQFDNFSSDCRRPKLSSGFYGSGEMLGLESPKGKRWHKKAVKRLRCDSCRLNSGNRWHQRGFPWLTMTTIKGFWYRNHVYSMKHEEDWMFFAVTARAEHTATYSWRMRISHFSGWLEDAAGWQTEDKEGECHGIAGQTILEYSPFKKQL